MCAASPTSRGSRRTDTVWMSVGPIPLDFQVKVTMASTDSSAAADAAPVVDSAVCALDARRRHHRQMLRRGIVVGLIVAIVGLLLRTRSPGCQSTSRVMAA